ncbi:MAG: hypothetical protein HC903_11520 [Methylacidiphilales bacterium]|nr:hypothetical protein [Candidatus Methylacidiphilales bacterium]NJR15504.1 hypothetical protein [Calothrix sp. CSU_2_0]
MQTVSTTQPATTSNNSQALNQTNTCVNTAFFVLAIAVFLVIRVVVGKEYRANHLKKQINKLEKIWLLEVKK